MQASYILGSTSLRYKLTIFCRAAMFVISVKVDRDRVGLFLSPTFLCFKNPRWRPHISRRSSERSLAKTTPALQARWRHENVSQIIAYGLAIPPDAQWYSIPATGNAKSWFYVPLPQGWRKPGEGSLGGGV